MGEVVDGRVGADDRPARAPGSRAASRTHRRRNPEENAATIRAIFEGAENGGRRDAILLNAAGAIAAAGHADDLRDGLTLAREALESGGAAARLERLVVFSQEAVVA